MAIVNLNPKSSMWTDYGKRQIALAMVHRGENFIGAGILLERQQGNGYVLRHLLCQGAELVLKGSLLLRDYDHYQPKLKKFGHNLIALADECAVAFKVHAPTGALRKELAQLNDLYLNHELRYASGIDLLIQPDAVPVVRVLKRLAAISVLVRREIRRAGATS